MKESSRASLAAGIAVPPAEAAPFRPGLRNQPGRTAARGNLDLAAALRPPRQIRVKAERARKNPSRLRRNRLQRGRTGRPPIRSPFIKLLLFPPLAALCCAAAQADSVDAAIVAAMRITEQPSYSWVTTVEDDVRTYDVQGMTRRDGFTRLKMPMTESVRRRLGRNAMDSVVEVIYHGKSRCVIETAEGWKSVKDLPWLVERSYQQNSALTAPSILTMGFPGSMGTLAPPTRRATVRRRPEASAAGAFSTLQLALNHPHEDLGVIVSSHAELHSDGEIAEGTLSELGAALLLIRDDESEVQPRQAAGTFKLWMRDGAVCKYQVKLQGVLELGARTFEVRQVTTTLIKDVGVTQFQIPDEARQKLGE